MTDQEVIALTLVAFAGAFLFRKLTGWPPRRREGEASGAVVSSRLERGLREAEKNRDRGCH
jgi:hypothetical protein